MLGHRTRYPYLNVYRVPSGAWICTTPLTLVVDMRMAARLVDNLLIPPLKMKILTVLNQLKYIPSFCKLSHLLTD